MVDFRFLVDVNLPKRFGPFNHPNFTHVADLDTRMTDTDIWHYAVRENLVILTKDTDFYYRSLQSPQRAKVEYFQLGNQTLRELRGWFDQYWADVLAQLETAWLVIAYPDRLESIA